MSTQKRPMLIDVHKLVLNEGDTFTTVAVHAGEGLNRNHYRYFADNLAEIHKTQEGQSVTLGHTVLSVGTVPNAWWNPEGDNFGPYMGAKIRIQNHQHIVDAIRNKDIREVSTTTLTSREFCTICEKDYIFNEDGTRTRPCLHVPGQHYTVTDIASLNKLTEHDKLAEVGLVVTNFGPLALVEKGADVKSIIMNQFTDPIVETPAEPTVPAPDPEPKPPKEPVIPRYKRQDTSDQGAITAAPVKDGHAMKVLKALGDPERPVVNYRKDKAGKLAYLEVGYKHQLAPEEDHKRGPE